MLQFKTKIILGVFFLVSIFAIFSYVYLNQSYLINQYQLKKSAEHTSSAKILMIVSSGKVVSFWPNAVDFETKMRLYGNLYEGLVQFDKNNNIKPALAVSWGNLDDLTWEYKLRKNVKFHDGSLFTAADVIRSYQEAMADKNSQIKVYFNDIATIEKIDDYKIIVKTKKPTAFLNQKLNYLLIGKQNNNGTWPYHFVNFNEEEGALSLEYFQDYWGDPPYFRKVVFQTIESKDLRTEGFAQGKIDILTAVPVDSSSIFEDKIKTVPSLEVSFLLFNLKNDLWKDLAVRQLAAGMITEDAISSIIGEYSHSINQFVSPGVFGYSLKIKPKKYDLQKAQAKAEELFGQEAYKINLDLTQDYRKIGEYVQKEFSKINIRVNLNFVSPQELIEKLSARKSEMFILGWQSESGDAGDMLNSLFLEGGQLNNCFSAKDLKTDVNRLIMESNQEFNLKKRLAKLQEIMEILVDQEVVGIPLFEGERIYAVNADVNFSPRTDGMIVLREIK